MVLLLAGALLSSLLIPLILSQVNYRRTANEARLKRALDFGNGNTEFNSKLTGLMNLMEEFHTQVMLHPTNLANDQQNFRSRYIERRVALGETAWWWYGDIERQVEALSDLPPEQFEELHQAILAYGQSATDSVIATKALASYLQSKDYNVAADGQVKFKDLHGKMKSVVNDEYYKRVALVKKIGKLLASAG